MRRNAKPRHAAIQCGAVDPQLGADTFGIPVGGVEQMPKPLSLFVDAFCGVAFRHR